jgi:putative endonuclease
MPYFYILYSASIDKFYIGSTNGAPEERLKKHLTKHNGFTARAKDWQIVHSEFFESIQSAKARESQVKAWKSKSRIQDLLQ